MAIIRNQCPSANSTKWRLFKMHAMNGKRQFTASQRAAIDSTALTGVKK